MNEYKITPPVLDAVNQLFGYMRLEHPLQKADLILTCGSYDLRPAIHAVELYHQGWAPKLLFSGGFGNFTQGVFDLAEADRFAAYARSQGVPEDDLIIENKSSNSGENISFSRAMLEGVEPQRIILVHKPAMLRRVFAAFSKQWPGTKYLCSGPNLQFSDLPHDHMDADAVINEICGDFQRILDYPARGYQIPQQVPQEIMRAHSFLLKEGYNKHCI